MVNENNVIKSKAPVISKATIAIFLDIDGVIFYNPMNGMVQERVRERFKGREHELPIPYPNIECDKAAVDLFDQSALNYLKKLILNINKKYHKEVAIILSSAWRINRSVEFLKDLFKQHFFANYIVDKTPELSCQSRSKEIAQWLLENNKYYNLCGFVILDDYDDYLSVDFPKQFVECKHTTLFKQSEYKLALSIIAKNCNHAPLFSNTNQILLAKD